MRTCRKSSLLRIQLKSYSRVGKAQCCDVSFVASELIVLGMFCTCFNCSVATKPVSQNRPVNRMDKRYNYKVTIVAILLVVSTMLPLVEPLPKGVAIIGSRRTPKWNQSKTAPSIACYLTPNERFVQLLTAVTFSLLYNQFVSHDM